MCLCVCAIVRVCLHCLTCLDCVFPVDHLSSVIFDTRRLVSQASLLLQDYSHLFTQCFMHACIARSANKSWEAAESSHIHNSAARLPTSFPASSCTLVVSLHQLHKTFARRKPACMSSTGSQEIESDDQHHQHQTSNEANHFAILVCPLEHSL